MHIFPHSQAHHLVVPLLLFVSFLPSLDPCTTRNLTAASFFLQLFFLQSVIFLRVFSTVNTVLCDCERVSVPRAHTAPRAYYIGRNEIDSLRNHATNTNVYIRSISGKPRSEGDLFFSVFQFFSELSSALLTAHFGEYSNEIRRKTYIKEKWEANA